MTLDGLVSASEFASVTDIARHRPPPRRRGASRDVSADGLAVMAALRDHELVGEAKLLVVCWITTHADRVSVGDDMEPPTILDAARMATGLRGTAALRWVASVVAVEAKRSDPALARYIDVDWPRLCQWAAGYLAEAHWGPEQPVGALHRVVPQVSRGDMLR
ncbi:hypothetical protein Mycsm_07081 (plasmid) [Mycobacterium sp. JS623]|uniref:hypothetical protein n=1 Tax=Mycobacterium sp. JS623 TaxID=212767 RepID=UPI0002A54F64|nr:hypothetical protein [Mycobacterium sp. JS623]AGB27178.1 hypothetical protein Mycsm_07081 [Mycobacterium sp. JS623]